MMRSFLSALVDRLGGGSETVTPGPTDRLRLSGKALRIPLRGSEAEAGVPAPCCFEVEMGRRRLQIHPDLAVDPGRRGPAPDFVLFDPERYLPGPGHFLRLAPGENLVLSHGAGDQRQLFSHPREAFRRHFQVRHEGNALVFKDPISELGTYVSTLESEGSEGLLAERRRPRRWRSWTGSTICSETLPIARKTPTATPEAWSSCPRP